MRAMLLGLLAEATSRKYSGTAPQFSAYQRRQGNMRGKKNKYKSEYG